MTDRELLRKIIELNIPENILCKDIGNEMFISESQRGLPACFFMDKLKELKPHITKETLFLIVYNYQVKSTEHKVLSGIGNERLKKEQERNKKELIKFWESGYLDL